VPVRVRADGVEVFLRVQPGARREELKGVVTGTDNRARLQLALTVAPEGGKANQRLLAMLAKHWKLPRSAMEIITHQPIEDTADQWRQRDYTGAYQS
jgi:uncharacterized protein YggU (UPF0235/DUF167 family)